MRHFALIGHKLGHSFSANFFNSKFAAEGIDADYQLIEIDDISTIRDVVDRNALDGFNVTIPYKESIIPYLDKLTKVAQEVGAVNCVEVNDGKLIGHNTDIIGIEASLNWLDIVPNTKALILGTGGASKAVQYALRKQEIDYLVVSRLEGKGDMTYGQITDEILQSFKLIINATPVGMYPNIEECPTLNYSVLDSSHRIFDLVYNPAETVLLKCAAERGANTMGGMLMLQTQAIASWHIWSSRKK